MYVFYEAPKICSIAFADSFQNRKRFRVYGLGFRVYGFYSEQFISIFVKVNTRDNSLRFLPRALLQSALLFGLFRDLGVKRRERGSGA
jgi:hypothetical protein